MSEDSGSLSSDSMELPPAAMREAVRHSTGSLSFPNGFCNSGGAPYAEIVEEPQQRGFRFRYRCEGPSHGGLQGEHSERGNKTYPSIKIHNYYGQAMVMVTLVTDEKVPRTHAHELMGKNCRNGICMMEVREMRSPQHVITFPNLGILHITKKKVEAILKERLTEAMRLDQHLRTSNFHDPLPDVNDDMKDKASKKAKEDSKKMQLNVVRLSFTVYLQDANGNFSHQLEPRISKPIYDSKCPGVAGLNICRMDRNAGCSTGNEEVFLLCDKVQKDDILVRFFERDEENQVKWEAFGNFGPSDVHRQYAIVFKTPAYRDPSIASPVQVMVQLRRISDHEISEPKPFTYFPQQIDKDEVGRKRKKTLPFDMRRYRDDSLVNGQHGTTGGPGVFSCGSTNGSTNTTSNTNNGGRVNSLSFMTDLLGCASGPRLDMACDPQLAAPASGLILPQALYTPHMASQQIFTKIPEPNMALVNAQTQEVKPMDITPAATTPDSMLQLEDLKVLLETCSEDFTTQLSVATLPDQKAFSQLAPQQQMYQQQLHQFMPDQQLPHGFPAMAQMAPLTQQTMQTAAMPQFSLNQQTIQAPPPPYTAPGQAQTQSPPYGQGQTPPYTQGQTPPYTTQAPLYTQGQTPLHTQDQTPPYTQGQTPPYTQGQTPPYNTQTVQAPYSPPQTQYSPISQQAFSPASQQTSQAYSPTMSQQTYSPSSTHSFSPGSQQHHQQQQPHQYSPPPPPIQQQPSPPTTQSYMFQETDLLTDGGDVEPDAVLEPTNDLTDDSDDIVCDDLEFADSDLSEDAVPMAPNEGRPLSDQFHRQHSSKHEEDEALAKDLEKLSLKPRKGSDSEEVGTEKGGAPKDERQSRCAEDNSEKLKVSIPMDDHKQSVLDLQLAVNVAKRSLIALHNYAETRDPVYLMLCHRHLISVQDDLGDTALHMAIMNRQTEVAVHLLQATSRLTHAGSDIVNTWNILRQTPLQLAVLTAQAHLIPLLLAQRANRHLVDKRGNTPLHLAARLGHTECVTALLQGDRDAANTQLDALNFEGFSALHLAIHHGHLEVMKALVARGADVNQRDGRSGRTALHHAVEADNHAMAGYILLKTDVDVNASAYDRNTALHMAVGRRLYAMAKLLVDSDANTEAESSEVISAEYEDDIVEDSDDVSEDGDVYGDDVTEDGGGSDGPCGYVRPLDMAAGDEKMLRILQHAAAPDLGFEDDHQLTPHDHGDLCCLDEGTLEALSEKLDAVTGQQAGWGALANGLGLMKAMDRFRDQPSPTRHLLDTYKSENGTLMELRRVLNYMERYDAAALVDKLIITQTQSGLDPALKLRSEIKDLSGPDSLDQGYRSSSLGSTLS